MAGEVNGWEHYSMQFQRNCRPIEALSRIGPGRWRDGDLFFTVWVFRTVKSDCVKYEVHEDSTM